jgi:hypothetical protein
MTLSSSSSRRCNWNRVWSHISRWFLVLHGFLPIETVGCGTDGQMSCSVRFRDYHCAPDLVSCDSCRTLRNRDQSRAGLGSIKLLDTTMCGCVCSTESTKKHRTPSTMARMWHNLYTKKHRNSIEKHDMPLCNILLLVLPELSLS